MMPHQSQGACQAIEDAAALGVIFSDKYNFTQDISAGLAMYQTIRKPRATRVQSASARATENLNERIGFTSLTPHDASLAAAEGKLTSEHSFYTQDRASTDYDGFEVNEMNSYNMHDHISSEVAGNAVYHPEC